MAKAKSTKPPRYKCNVCGKTAATLGGIQGHLRFSKDQAHAAAGVGAYTEIAGIPPATGMPPTPPQVPYPPAPQPVNQPAIYAAAAPDPRLNQVCTDVACIKGQMEALTQSFKESIKPPPAAPPATTAPSAPPIIGHGEHEVGSEHRPATVDDVIDHAIECKDGKCTVVLRKKVLTNWSRLFPNLSILSAEQREKYDAWVEQQDAAAKPPAVPPATTPPAPAPAVPPADPPPTEPASPVTDPPPAAPPADPPATLPADAAPPADGTTTEDGEEDERSFFDF